MCVCIKSFLIPVLMHLEITKKYVKIFTVCTRVVKTVITLSLNTHSYRTIDFPNSQSFIFHPFQLFLLCKASICIHHWSNLKRKSRSCLRQYRLALLSEGRNQEQFLPKRIKDNRIIGCANNGYMFLLIEKHHI